VGYKYLTEHTGSPTGSFVVVAGSATPGTAVLQIAPAAPPRLPPSEGTVAPYYFTPLEFERAVARFIECGVDE